MNRRVTFSAISVLLLAMLVHAEGPPNVLIVTVDDMSADSLGVFGCELAGTSPNIDAFAKQSMRFNRAHVHVGNCMPGRNIMWSGMFSHVNGVEGFVQNKNADYVVLCDVAKSAGYFSAIRGKVSHSTPYHPYAWDAVLDEDPSGKKFHIKDAASYGASTREGIQLAKRSGKPFCLMINISDPHKPFYAQGRGGETVDDPHVPSRVFHANEVPVPGFLPDDMPIRKELAHYYSSVRRADDCFGEVMRALEESGEESNTFVLFLSDHGMPLPFAKTQLYHHSTHTPLMVRWPGVTAAGSVDQRHMVGAIDFLPTLLDVMRQKHPQPDRLQGRSFASLLRGETQSDRDFVILQYNENSGGNRHPMRGIHTPQYLYLYNAWSNGERKFASATTGTVTYRQMVKRAAQEPEIAARLRLFDHRVLEELYDVEQDPDCLNNLANDPKMETVKLKLREQLAASLAKMEDPIAPLVTHFDNDSLREAYMTKEDARAEKARRARSNGRRQQAR
jgi:N-sulfoglucosamine sulfohydrolase